MRITKLQLENFKGFEGKVSVVFPKENLAVIVGVNGSGKSSVLKPLVFLLNKFISSFLRVNAGSDIEINALDINVNAIESHFQMYFETSLSEKERFSYGFVAKTGTSNYVFQNEINQFANRVLNSLGKNSIKNLPIICFYSPSRSTPSNDNYKQVRFPYPQLETYFGALNPKYFFNYFTDWFLEQTNIENQLKVEKRDFTISNPRLVTVRNALNSFLEHFPYAKFKNLRIGTSALSEKLNKKQTLVIDKDDKKLAVSQLSDGEKSVIQMVVDIAYRLSIANPTRNPLKGDGIVMIDELDLHLHPSWQKAITNCLQATFPNIQFIVTTHSPLIISQVQKEAILVLNQNKCTPLTQYINNTYNSYGSDLEDILKIIMGTGELLPPKLAKTFKKYFQLIEENKIAEAKKLQIKLSELTDSQHPDILKGQTLIDLKELGVS